MTRKKNLEETPMPDTSFSESYNVSTGAGRRIRKISPLGMRVLVRIRKDVKQTEAGLYLPEGAKEAQQESLLGEVLEVASAIDDETEEETNISGIPLGSLVLLPKKAGVRVPWSDDLRIVDTKEILATVTEVDVV